MSQKVFITGMGIISSLGRNVEENAQSLLIEKTGIGEIKYLDTIHKHEFVAGEVKFSDQQLSELSSTSKGKYNRTTLLALIAAQEALNSSGNFHTGKTGLISSSTVGGMGHSEKFYQDFFSKKTNINFIDQHFCGVSTNDVAHELGINDFVTTISTACSSAANAIMLGARLIKSGRLDRVVVGGVDTLTKFTLNGFNTLMILDKEWCKPFDNERKGLNLGEGAAFIVLESAKSLAANNKTHIGVLSGYGNANDAFHQTASSAEGFGAHLAMEIAFKSSQLSPAQINYVNAHGTGTPNNDSSEGLALQRIFNNQVPPFSSTKAYTGHTLAASAGIEAVISLLAISQGKLFPNLNRKNNMSDLVISPVLKITDAKVDHVLSNSFGFGGNCSSLIFSRN